MDIKPIQRWDCTFSGMAHDKTGRWIDYDDHTATVAALQARNAELEKDAERLDKIIVAFKVSDHLYCLCSGWCWYNDQDDQITNYYVTAREAIDALCQPIDAMKD